MTNDIPYDPKGLIREAFAIPGITAGECRSIFLDWALGLPDTRDTQAELQGLISRYAPQNPEDHPMLATLRAGLDKAAPPKRRGGRRARVTPDGA